MLEQANHQQVVLVFVYVHVIILVEQVRRDVCKKLSLLLYFGFVLCMYVARSMSMFVCVVHCWLQSMASCVLAHSS